jgi:hypothetical protein
MKKANAPRVSRPEMTEETMTAISAGERPCLAATGVEAGEAVPAPIAVEATIVVRADVLVTNVVAILVSVCLCPPSAGIGNARGWTVLHTVPPAVLVKVASDPFSLTAVMHSVLMTLLIVMNLPGASGSGILVPVSRASTPTKQPDKVGSIFQRYVAVASREEVSVDVFVANPVDSAGPGAEFSVARGETVCETCMAVEGNLGNSSGRSTESRSVEDVFLGVALGASERSDVLTGELGVGDLGLITSSLFSDLSGVAIGASKRSDDSGVGDLVFVTSSLLSDLSGALIDGFFLPTSIFSKSIFAMFSAFQIGFEEQTKRRRILEDSGINRHLYCWREDLDKCYVRRMVSSLCVDRA